VFVTTFDYLLAAVHGRCHFALRASRLWLASVAHQPRIQTWGSDCRWPDALMTLFAWGASRQSWGGQGQILAVLLVAVLQLCATGAARILSGTSSTALMNGWFAADPARVFPS
jgi:hypothetical protein